MRPNFLKKSAAALAFAIGLVAFSSTLSASTVSSFIRGTVDGGVSFDGRFTYDTDAPDLLGANNVGVFNLQSWQIKFTGLSLPTSSPFNSTLISSSQAGFANVTIANSFPDLSQPSTFTLNFFRTPIAGAVDGIQLFVQTIIPPPAGNPNTLNLAPERFYNSVLDPSVGGLVIRDSSDPMSQELVGRIESVRITPVPGPVPAVLLLTSLLGLGALRARSRRA